LDKVARIETHSLFARFVHAGGISGSALVLQLQQL
jgi:hypothetical protein